MRTILFLAAALGSTSCGAGPQTNVDITARKVTLPDGTVITAETRLTPSEQAAGLMYRTELPPDRGMLFLNTQTVTGPYWMKNCKFPLDIIFMSPDHRVVEIAANAPPCTAEPCPTFGGHVPYQYVLEINGGDAARHGVKEGTTLGF